jgi:cytoskeletal protein CcmA (bactofilin family)
MNLAGASRALSASAHFPEIDSASSRAGGSDSVMSRIGGSVVIRGSLSGSGALLIDGKIEGSIVLPTAQVTVGPLAEVSASIDAREIVILGKVIAENLASDSVSVSSTGSITGNVTTQTISVAEGALLSGRFDVSQARPIAVVGSDRAAAYDAESEKHIAEGKYADLKEGSNVADLLPVGSPFRKKMNSR